MEELLDPYTIDLRSSSIVELLAHSEINNLLEVHTKDFRIQRRKICNELFFNMHTFIEASLDSEHI